MNASVDDDVFAIKSKYYFKIHCKFSAFFLKKQISNTAF